MHKSADFPQDTVRRLDASVQLPALGHDAFLLHLGSGNAHVDGGQLVHTARGVTAVVDALRAVVPFQKLIGKVSPHLAPDLSVLLTIPVHKVNLSCLKIF